MSQPVPPVVASGGVEPSYVQGGREAARQARLQREALALRENLRRRKGQTRARIAVEPPAPEPPVAD